MTVLSLLYDIQATVYYLFDVIILQSRLGYYGLLKGYKWYMTNLMLVFFYYINHDSINNCVYIYLYDLCNTHQYFLLIH